LNSDAGLAVGLTRPFQSLSSVVGVVLWLYISPHTYNTLIFLQNIVSMSDSDSDSSRPVLQRRQTSRELIGEEKFNDLRHLLQATFPSSAKLLQIDDSLVESVADLLVVDADAGAAAAGAADADDDADGSFASANIFGINKTARPALERSGKHREGLHGRYADKVCIFIGVSRKKKNNPRPAHNV
jgi:hypothetical protein